MIKKPSALRRTIRFAAVVPLVAIVLSASAASGQSLGSAQSFAVLGASTVTNTGATAITGNVGVSPGTAITGFLPAPANTIAGPGTVTPGPGIVTGTIYAGGMVAAQAHADAALAFAALGMFACNVNLSGQVLGAGALSTLPSGVYCFNTSAQLTGTLTLTGTGPWIFKVGTTLTTASNSAVVVADAGTTCSGSNVFWRIGSSATLGTGTRFAGNTLAMTSITATSAVSVSGSLMALTGAVTLDTNVVSACPAGSGGSLPPVDKCEPKHRHHHHHGDGDDDGHDGDDDDHDGDHHDHDGDHHDKDKDHHDKDKDHKDDDKDHDGKYKKRG